MIHHWKNKKVALFSGLTFCVLLFTASSVKADLNTKQARKLITRIAGFELPSSAVRVKSITTPTAGAAEVLAEIRTVFKLEKDNQGRWKVAEIRTGQDRWEQVDFIAGALNAQIDRNECIAPDPPFKGSAAVDPSFRRARCLLGSLFGVEGPSDAIRIQQVSLLGIPMASQPSAVIVAWVRFNVALVNEDKSGWRIAALSTAPGHRVTLEPVVAAINEIKSSKAKTELESIARALELFRAERGFYVVSEKHAEVIDHLNPRFLARVIRVDPWHQPYNYQGERDHFRLRSIGPDGKEGTADDIQLDSRR